ncbi:MAG TPA: trypsin-like serine protease [Kofleriaceae bacterium]|nr:trypsin-like serine protease [Kofleriaceae bacterium]
MDRMSKQWFAVAIAPALFVSLNGSGCMLADDDRADDRVGDSQSEVVLGSVEPNYNFPWVVTVDSGVSFSCHGVLISPRWVLTAAHCIDTTHVGVTVGYTRTDAAGRTITGSQQTGAGSTFLNPDYDIFDFHDDIGLVRLSTALPDDPLLRPAMLPFDPVQVGQQGVLASTVHHPSVPLPPGTDAVLRGAVSPTLSGPTAFPVRSPTASACPGDSGSGFITNVFGETIVAGIAANIDGDGKTCTAPNVEFRATQVAAYADWIHDVTQLPKRHLADRSAEFGTPAASGVPTTAIVPGLGVHNIGYRETSGHLRELWRDAQGRTGTTDLTANAGATTAAGNPSFYVDAATSTEILLYRGSDSGVHSLYWTTGAVGHDALSAAAGAPTAAGNPIGWLSPDGFNHVIYRTGSARLQELYWAGFGGVGHGDLTFTYPLIAGDPSGYVDIRGTNVVFYRGADAHVHSLYWTTGAVGHDDLSGFAGTPLAASDPVAYYIPQSDVNQVVYRASDAHIYELLWQGANAVLGWDLLQDGAPAATGRPAAYFSAGTGTKHVVYRSADGGLHDLSWIPGVTGPAHRNLTAAHGAPPAADSPAAFAVEGGANRQHVVYRATDNHIWEIIW